MKIWETLSKTNPEFTKPLPGYRYLELFANGQEQVFIAEEEKWRRKGKQWKNIGKANVVNVLKL